MFWGKNIKSNETYPLDSDKSLIGRDLNITNISLSDALDNVKYFIKIIDNNQVYQICSLEKNRDSMTSSLSFKIKKGLKLSVKGGNRGTISFVGYLENFDNPTMEEISTDKEKEIKEIKNKEKTEVIPELKKERKESKEDKEIKEQKEEKEELEEDEESEDKMGKMDDDDDDEDELDNLDDEMKEEEDEEEEEND